MTEGTDPANEPGGGTLTSDHVGSLDELIAAVIASDS